jgi:hypothetical protein
MDLYVLSLPEASSVYMGLAYQAMLRTSSLRHLPVVLVLCGTLWLLWKAATQQRSYWAALEYVATALVVCLLFWSEISPFGRGLSPTLAADQVASYAATQDPGAEIRTAADMPSKALALPEVVAIPPGFRPLLNVVVHTPLALGRAMHPKLHQTVAGIMPLSWLLNTPLSGEVSAQVADWVESCYRPRMATMMQASPSSEDLWPWSPAMQLALNSWEMTPGSSSGLTFLKATTTSRATIPCDAMLGSLEQLTQTWLRDTQTPAGNSLGVVVEEALRLDSQAQARFVLWRETLRALDHPIAPSLAAQYAGLRGVRVGAPAVGSGLIAGLGALVGGAGGGLVGRAALDGSAGSLQTSMGDELKRLVDSLSWFVAIGLFLTWWSPYILGYLECAMVALFPVVVLWSLVPGATVRPLTQYFVALAFVFSSPIWWALIDRASTFAAANAPVLDVPGLAALSGFLTAQIWAMVVTTLGILLMPVVVSAMLFASFRAIGHAWRAGA